MSIRTCECSSWPSRASFELLLSRSALRMSLRRGKNEPSPKRVFPQRSGPGAGGKPVGEGRRGIRAGSPAGDSSAKTKMRCIPWPASFLRRDTSRFSLLGSNETSSPRQLLFLAYIVRCVTSPSRPRKIARVSLAIMVRASLAIVVVSPGPCAKTDTAPGDARYFPRPPILPSYALLGNVIFFGASPKRSAHRGR